jgi:hypothetical protein
MTQNKTTEETEEKIRDLVWCVWGAGDEFRFRSERGIKKSYWNDYKPEKVIKKLLALILKEREEAVKEFAKKAKEVAIYNHWRLKPKIRRKE